MSSASVHTFTAMGCEIAVAGASPSAQAAVEDLFRARDRMFSRFIGKSELNHVNAAAGQPVHVSDEFARMVRVGLDAAEESGGLVDPTLGAALVSAGYDVDFALLPHDGPAAVRGEPGCWRSVRLRGRFLLVPAANVQLDLNGVVKGATVDDALTLIGGSGWVSAGGDLLTGTEGVIVALPGGGTVRLERGALATSGVDRRRWVRGGREQHHLIDPRTGAPASSPWRSVTACAATCLGADVAAKIGFFRGASARHGWTSTRSRRDSSGLTGSSSSTRRGGGAGSREHMHLTSSPLDHHLVRIGGINGDSRFGLIPTFFAGVHVRPNDQAPRAARCRSRSGTFCAACRTLSCFVLKPGLSGEKTRG